jgi:hypothetical protein
MWVLPEAWVAGGVELRVPFDFAQGRLSATSGFPVRLSGSVSLMRLSSKKPAYVGVGESSVAGNPEFAPTARRSRRDDKGEGGAFMGNWLVAEKTARTLHFATFRRAMI